jgi:hypothetical protein
MTRESLYTIRKYLTRARVSGYEEEEFFWALKQLDGMIAVSNQIPRDTQRVA